MVTNVTKFDVCASSSFRMGNRNTKNKKFLLCIYRGGHKLLDNLDEYNNLLSVALTQNLTERCSPHT